MYTVVLCTETYMTACWASISRQESATASHQSPEGRGKDQAQDGDATGTNKNVADGSNNT